MGSVPGLDSIRDFLVRLDLNPSRLPTVSEYKKAYREKLKNHPDKGGDTAIFQGITEASMAVWQFMATNQDRQSRPETDKDTALLRKFEKSNNVSYNKGSVVFDIDGSKADIWIDCLKKRVGPPETLSDGSGVKMKVEQFKIPLVSCKTKQMYGSLSVTVYPNPKTSHPKVMVQGQAYLAFVTLVLPEVFKDMASPRLAIGGASTAGNMSDIESDDEQQPDKQTQLDMVTHNSMEQAFHRMELEMVNIRESIGSKVDAALGNLAANKAGLDSKLDTLENLMNENLKKSEQLGQAVTELSSNIKNTNTNINIESSHVEKIAASVCSHPSLSQLSTTLTSLRSEVAQSANLEAVQITVQGQNLTVLEEQEVVNMIVMNEVNQKEVVETILMNVENQQEMVKRSTVEKKVKVVDMNIGY